jgi:hypothetical protein
MQPEMNLGASVTNCESSRYTAATLTQVGAGFAVRWRTREHRRRRVAMLQMRAHLQPPSFMRSASERSTGECEYSSICAHKPCL